MIYDCFTFFNEYDLLEIRFNVLDMYVDRFVLVESSLTFSGNHKPLYWEKRDKERFKKFENKVIHLVVDDYGKDESIMKLIAERIYVDQPSFKRSFYQKESIKKCLVNCMDEDIIYYGDTDEIWEPQEVDDKVYKLRQLAYSYYLNNRSPEDWRGTIVTKYKNVREGCLNDMRANPVNILEDGGWHFTNMGGIESVVKKLESYDHQEANVPWVKDNLQARMDSNMDFLGRNYQFWVDHSELPYYILKNKDKYKHLWKS